MNILKTLTITSLAFVCALTKSAEQIEHLESSRINHVDLRPIDAKGCYRYKNFSLNGTSSLDGSRIDLFNSPDCTGPISRSIEIDTYIFFHGIWNDFLVVNTSIAANQEYFSLFSLNDESLSYEFRYEGDRPVFSVSQISFYSPSESAIDENVCQEAFISADVFIEILKNTPEHFQMTEKHHFDINTKKITVDKKDMSCSYLQ